MVDEMTKIELINGIRLDLQKEQDAISTYMSQVHATSNTRARKVLKSIADEERVHVGELTKLLEVLNNEDKYLDEGEGEVVKTLNLHEPKERAPRCKSRHRKHMHTHRLLQPNDGKGVINLSAIR
jgi:rubrerythrin